MSEGKSLAIYNCQTCMFITKNKKDYERHLRSKKHQDSIERKPLIFANVHNDDTSKDDTFQKMPVCPNCKKVYKCRTSVYTHMKKCGVAAPAAAPAMTETHQIASPETFTHEQIQYILIENRIIKELLKNVIQGINPPILAAPK